MTKVCGKCGESKSSECFHRRKKSKDGLSTRCKKCVSYYHAERRKDPEFRVYNAKYQANYHIKRWKNPEVRKHKAEYVAKRINSDVDFGVRCRIRGLIRESLRKQNHHKSSKTVDLLGCSIPEFKQYLESLFLPGMTWDNWGSVWQVDHVRPCASFDLGDPDQQKECFNYKNCRPLWRKDNIRKSSWWNGKLYRNEQSVKLLSI